VGLWGGDLVAVISKEEARSCRGFSRRLGKGIERFKKLAAAAQVGLIAG
jgi:hypothetical protein